MDKHPKNTSIGVRNIADTTSVEQSFLALRNTPNMSSYERKKNLGIITSGKRASWAYHTLLEFLWLSDVERDELIEVISAARDTNWAYAALYPVGKITLSKNQRLTLQLIFSQ